MLTQVDADGFSSTVIKGMIDYKVETSVAIAMSDKYLTTKTGQRRLRKTTIGWSLLVLLADETKAWIKGGKAAGRDFRNHLRSYMHFLNFKSCPADPDVWMRPAKKSDGTLVYYHILFVYG